MAGRKDRVEAVQLLRALAAGTVALVHIAFGFADHIGSGLGLPRAFAGQAGQIAVAVFFVISGYVMVVSSSGLFGSHGAARYFWARRINRIMPPYWLATMLLVGWLLFLGRDVEWIDLGRSLLLIPYWNGANDAQPLPMLWPGWTLFYEMVFYALFGVCLVAGRRAVPAFVCGAIAVLMIIGTLFEPHGALMFSLTRPVLLLFPCGIMLAIWRSRGMALPPWLRWSAIISAFVAASLMQPPNGDWLGLAYMWWAGVPAVLLAVGALGGPLRLAGFRAVDRLGDASYALYLLHLPVAMVWIWIYVRVAASLGSWGFVLSCVALTYGVSLLFYRFVERPVTRALNRHLPHIGIGVDLNGRAEPPNGEAGSKGRPARS